MSTTNPIGFFDSGVGGTSIWRECIRLLPKEDSIFLADSKNAPYGEKPVEEIVALSIKNTEKLLSMGCKLIVVACNTATTNAIDYLRATYEVPFIGIEPAIKPAALKSQSRIIGILATKGTLTSALFSKTSNLYSHDTTLIEVVGTGLVPLVEQGQHQAPQTEQLLRKLLKPMIAARIDYLVLGCSHYPYLIPILKRILPPGVSIIDSGEAVARQTQRILQERDLLNNTELQGTHQLYTNLEPAILASLVEAEKYNYGVSYLEF